MVHSKKLLNSNPEQLGVSAEPFAGQWSSWLYGIVAGIDE